MTIKAVFFDLDGTLLDTALDLGAALNALLLEEGKAPLPLQQVRHVASNGARGMLKEGFGIEPGDPRFDEYRQRFLDYYLDNIAEHTEFFDGIESLIENLTQHQIIWGIATNKPLVYTEALLKHFQFASQPDCIVCPEHVGAPKPDPAFLKFACEQANCHIDQSLYVGDHLRDIECGQKVGMRTVAAAYGYLDKNENYQSWQADYNVEKATELWPLISKLI